MVRRRSTVRFRNGAPQELTCEARSEAHWTAPILRGGWGAVADVEEFGRSPSVRALLGQTMASVYGAGRSRTRSLPTPSFEHLGSTPGSTPLRRARRGCGRGPDAAPFKQDIDLLIEGLQLAAQRQQAEARQEPPAACSGVRPWPSSSARPAAKPTPGSYGFTPASNSTDARPRRAGEDVAVTDRGQVLGLTTGPLA